MDFVAVPSRALPLIETFTGHLSDFTSHLGADDDLGVEELVQVGHHQALEVDAAVGPAVLDALDSGGDTPKDAHLVTSEVELPALEVGHAS